MANNQENMRLLQIRKAFSEICNINSSESPFKHKVNALEAVDELIKTSSNKDEKESLKSAKDAIMSGKKELIDAAGFRMRKIFSSYVPSRNLRMAYTYIKEPLQGEPSQKCPKALHQLGRIELMPISTCRDQCIDSRVEKDGSVRCAYSEWLDKVADSQAKYYERFDTIHPAENKENSINLEGDKRLNDPKEVEKSLEERMNELGTRNKLNLESLDKELTKLHTNKELDKLKDAKETVFNQNDDKEPKDYSDEAFELLLEDKRVGLSEEDLDKVLETWLEEYHEYPNETT